MDFLQAAADVCVGQRHARNHHVKLPILPWQGLSLATNEANGATPGSAQPESGSIMIEPERDSIRIRGCQCLSCTAADIQHSPRTGEWRRQDVSGVAGIERDLKLFTMILLSHITELPRLLWHTSGRCSSAPAVSASGAGP